MTCMQILPNRLDRADRIRIARQAEQLRRRTEPRKQYGQLTQKHLDVLRALLWLSGTAADQKKIAAWGDCSETMVHQALIRLVDVGLVVRGQDTLTLIVPEGVSSEPSDNIVVTWLRRW